MACALQPVLYGFLSMVPSAILFDRLKASAAGPTSVLAFRTDASDPWIPRTPFHTHMPSNLAWQQESEPAWATLDGQQRLVRDVLKHPRAISNLTPVFCNMLLPRTRSCLELRKFRTSSRLPHARHHCWYVLRARSCTELRVSLCYPAVCERYTSTRTQATKTLCTAPGTEKS